MSGNGGPPLLEIQGLKKHWLLRSAFKKPKEPPKKTEPDKAPPPRIRTPIR